MNTKGLFKVLDSKTIKNLKIEILNPKELAGASDVKTAEKLFFARQAGLTVKIIKLALDNTEIIIEPGALYYMHGNIQIDSKAAGGLGKGLARKILSGETLFQTTLKGTGEVFLEPSYGHFVILELDDDTIIADKGAFFCGSKGMSASAVSQRNLSSAFFGGEGFFQTKITGSGLAILNCPVPEKELVIYELANGEKLSVDGSFAFARTANVKFRVEKSTKSLFRSATSGEGLLQTFTGPGFVWLAPTQNVYTQLALEHGIKQLNDSIK